jgi:putative transcriptional regulator
MTKCKTNILKELRIQKGLTFDNMAQILGVSKAFYWQIEHKNRRLTYDFAKKIAAVFNLKPDDIFYEDN